MKQKIHSLYAYVLFLGISVAYFIFAIHAALFKPLWMDEVLALTAAQQPNLTGVYAVLWAGTDYCPPTYHILLHALAQFGDSPLLFRMPSIGAIFLASVLLLQIVRRHSTPLLAVLACGLTLSFFLFDFALQVRPYALLTLCFTVSLYCWDRLDDQRPSMAYGFLLWLAFAFSLSLHFYGFVSVAVVCMAEVLWCFKIRRFRWDVWLPVAFSLLVELAWLPYAWHLSRFNAADSHATAYYSRPQLTAFIYGMRTVLVGGGKNSVVAATLFVAVIVSAYFLRRSAQRYPWGKLETLSLALALLPPIVFTFSVQITKSFNVRYTAPAALFLGLFTVCCVRRLPANGLIAFVLLAMSAKSMYVRANRPDGISPLVTAMQANRLPLPVVVANGRDYIELMRDAAPSTGRDLVFLKSPANFIYPDPTNNHEVLHLAPFIPGYKVEDQVEFVTQHEQFYILISKEQPAQKFAPWVLRKEFARSWVWDSEDASLFLVTLSPSAKTPSPGNARSIGSRGTAFLTGYHE